MRRTTNRRPVRLTESRLRQIIRSVIRESLEDLPTVKNQVQIQWSYNDRSHKEAIKSILSACSKHRDLKIMGIEPHEFMAGASHATSHVRLLGQPYTRDTRDANSYDNYLDPTITYNISLNTHEVESGKHPLAKMTFTLTPEDGPDSRYCEPHVIEVEVQATSGYVDIIRIECLD